ncbi:MAG: hypothetical protein FJ363_08010 [Gemmatimonadetes bacterium]|nr:hypothetical protein [Gemmatimonadota bacterium]
MRTAMRIIGWIALALSAVLVALGILSWPPGGLMFALPFVFLIPGLALLALAVLLLWLSGRASAPSESSPSAGSGAGSTTT